MDKRSFIRIAFAGGAAGLVVPRLALGAHHLKAALESKLAGGVYYTEDALGRWSKGVADHHLPNLEKQVSGGASQLQVETNHPMGGYGHYIIKHQLLNEEFGFMQEHLYNPTKDKSPAHTFDIGDYRGVVYAVTVCNVHDTWVNMIEV